MKRLASIFFLLIGVSFTGIAQELNDYKFIQVPQEFESFKDENQYQVNALTAFLLEKEGFEVYYKKDTPRDLAVCDLLKANLRNDSGLFTTKVTLVLEDCYGNEVFVSKEGRSREKEYQAAYHEAIRDAFSSLEEVGYAYSGKSLPKGNAVASKDVVDNETKPERAEQTPQISREPARQPASGVYRNGATDYRLESNSSGYTIFRGEDEEAFANLLRSGGGDNFIYTSNGLQGSAYFDAEGNLIVEYVDAHSGQLVAVKYLLQD